MRQMPAGQWVPFEGYNNVHKCDSPPVNQNSDQVWHGRDTARGEDHSSDIYQGLGFLDVQLPAQPKTGINIDGGAHGRDSRSSGKTRKHKEVRKSPPPQSGEINQRSTYNRSVGQSSSQKAWQLSDHTGASSSYTNPTQLPHTAETRGPKSRSPLILFLGMIGVLAMGLLILIALYIYKQNAGEDDNSQVDTNTVSTRQTPQSQNKNDNLLSSEQQAKAFYDQGVTLTRSGQYAEAIKAYQQAVSLNPAFAEAHHELGYAYYKLGRYEDSVASSKQAIELKSKNADTYNNLGLANEALGRWDEAAKAYKQVVSINPNSAVGFYKLGRALKNTKNNEAAIEAYQEAIRLKPDYAVVHYELGLSYLAIGDQDAAMNEYTTLSSLNQRLASQLYDEIYKQSP
jgi:tetratricopeptide (TPR) repeat protein